MGSYHAPDRVIQRFLINFAALIPPADRCHLVALAIPASASAGAPPASELRYTFANQSTRQLPSREAGVKDRQAIDLRRRGVLLAS